MHIAVLVKQVPDTDDVKMDPVSGTMIREGVGGIVNPLDLNALEAAMRLKRPGDTVTAISMGPPAAEESLRECLALGADRALLGTDRIFAGGDSWATSKVLSAMLRHIGLPDLVIAGEKATDGETGQVGPEVAAILGIPFAARVCRAETKDRDNEEIEVDCTLEEGLVRQRIPLPCLVTVISDINTPSLPTLSGKKRAYSSHVELLTASELGIGEDEAGLRASPTRVVRIETPTVARNTERFLAKHTEELEAGLDRIIDILADASII